MTSARARRVGCKESRAAMQNASILAHQARLKCDISPSQAGLTWPAGTRTDVPPSGRTVAPGPEVWMKSTKAPGCPCSSERDVVEKEAQARRLDSVPGSHMFEADKSLAPLGSRRARCKEKRHTPSSM